MVGKRDAVAYSTVGPRGVALPCMYVRFVWACSICDLGIQPLLDFV